MFVMLVVDWAGVHAFRGRGVLSGEEGADDGRPRWRIGVYLIVAVVLAVLAKLLKLHDEQEPAIAHRSVGMAIPMVLLAAFSYLVYYEIFGAITFQFFTKGYYPHAAEQVAAMGAWFFGYQIARGLVMTLAVLPVIYTLRLPRLQAALIVGLLVWVVGGAAPLLVPNEMMSATQRYIHVGEIFTQNFLLGMTATLLMRPRKAAAVDSSDALRDWFSAAVSELIGIFMEVQKSRFFAYQPEFEE